MCAGFVVAGIALALLGSAVIHQHGPAQAALQAIHNPVRLTGISHGQKSVSSRVEVRNCSRKTVTVSKVLSSCGCLEANLDRRTLQPGESGELSITLALPLFTPRVSKRIVLVPSDEKQAPLPIEVEAEINVPALVQPQAVAFGSVGMADLPISVQVAVSEQSAQVIHVRSDMPQVDVTSERTGEKGVLLTCSLIPGVSGVIRGQLIIETSTNETLLVPVSAEIVHEVRTVPESIAFVVNGESLPTKHIQVINEQLTHVTSFSAPEFLTVSLGEAKEGKTSVSIACDPQRLAAAPTPVKEAVRFRFMDETEIVLPVYIWELSAT